MRVLDLRQINPGPAWLQKAKDAEAAVLAGGKVNDYANVWSEIKGLYADLSHGKCWYCESREGRSDNAIDHFRPKSKYPFLAFSPTNFRYACTFCNSRRRNPETGEAEGKGDHFPLFRNSPLAKTKDELVQERPILIDPCIAIEAGLLDFLSDGRPQAVRPAPADLVERVEKSIKFYHLDHPELIEQRRLLALRLKDWITAANGLYPLTLSGADPAVDAAFSGLVQNIYESLNERAELSLFARRMVKIHRSIPWVDALLDNA